MSRKFRYNDLLITLEPESEERSDEGCSFCTRVTVCRPATALPAGQAAFGECGRCTLVTGCPTATTVPQQGVFAYGGCGVCTLITGCTTTTFDPTSGTVPTSDLEAYKADLKRHLADVEALTAGPSSDELADLEHRLESALAEVRQQRSELQESSSKSKTKKA